MTRYLVPACLVAVSLIAPAISALPLIPLSWRANIFWVSVIGSPLLYPIGACWLADLVGSRKIPPPLIRPARLGLLAAPAVPPAALAITIAIIAEDNDWMIAPVFMLPAIIVTPVCIIAAIRTWGSPTPRPE